MLEGWFTNEVATTIARYGVNSTGIRSVSTFRPFSLMAFRPSSDCSISWSAAMSGTSAMTPVQFGLSGLRKFRHLIPSLPNISCQLPGPFFQALALTSPS
jgi:hypothetical protein